MEIHSILTQLISREDFIGSRMPFGFITFFPKRFYFVTFPEILLASLMEQSLAYRGFTSHRFKVLIVFHVYLFLSTGQLVLYPPYLLVCTMKNLVTFSQRGPQMLERTNESIPQVFTLFF